MGSPPVSAWTLHPQLEADTSTIGDLALSRLLLANDANYPWLLLVPRCTGASEIIDLSESDQNQLAAEIAAASRALKAVAPCDKLNVAALGNVVPQLHVHVIARCRGDQGLARGRIVVARRCCTPHRLRPSRVAALRRELWPEK